MKEWFVYIVRCADGTLYTGHAANVERRLIEHNSGRGARYTRARLPVALVYCERVPDRSQAARRETEIKQLPREAKLQIISQTADDRRNCR
jgi:predicted GIY-YIG superfamily endonuclease